MPSKEQTNQERRREKRTRLYYFLQVLDPDSLEVVGHLMDVSRLGIAMDTTRPLPVGKEFRFRIDTTPEVADKVYIQFDARVRWCKPDKIQPNFYNIGFEITAIVPQDSEIIQNIADRYGEP